MRYFPLQTNRFEHQFGIRALDPSESIIEATSQYREQIDCKRRLLESSLGDYFQMLPGSEASQAEAASLVQSHAAFLSEDSNVKLQESLPSPGSLPLLAVARQVQEDLVIVGGDASAGYPLIAGVVCFPSGWSIGEKLGKSMLEIHAPVPEFATRMGRSTARLLEQLKAGRPVWRMNWGLRCSGQLDQSPKHAETLRRAQAMVTADNAGQRCYFRVERQTLTRLAGGGDVLFTIHTHQCRLDELADWQRHNLLGVLESCPDPTLAYKGILPIKPTVVKYLRS